MTIGEINKAIKFGTLSVEDLDLIVEAIKYRRNEIARATKRQLIIGGEVQFDSSRQNRKVTGTVVKINRKFVIVREASQTGGLFSTNWRVPASMLTVL